MDAYTPPLDHTRLIDALLNAGTRNARRLAEEALEAVVDREAVPALIAALHSANSRQSYRAISRLLAARPTDETVEELARQVRENKRFPNLPIRALALCTHPAALDALIQVMERGRAKQRRTAMDALGELGDARVIEPLCWAAAHGKSDSHFARAVLQRMGRPGRLALLALEDPRLTDAACARSLMALEVLPVYVFPLSFASFKAEKFLLGIAEKKSPLQDRARTVLERVRDRLTLLRAAPPGEGEHLLRPAANRTGSESGELLRGSEAPLPKPSGGRKSWWPTLKS
jgi:hypothetical protein